MAGENQHQTLRKSIAAHQPAAPAQAPPQPPQEEQQQLANAAGGSKSSIAERVTLKKEIGLLSACAIIIGTPLRPPA